MRTVFVNPRKKSRKRKRKVGRPKGSSSARKRRSRRKYRKVPYRIVRRNSGIAPFIQNPMIMQNPPRRRRRRRNPSLSGLLNPRKFLGTMLTLGGGSAIGAGANILAARKIENEWLRMGARVVAAYVGSSLLPGGMGAAMAGSMLYPLWAELALKTKLIDVAGDDDELGADLSGDEDDLGADLSDLLDDDDDLLG